MSADLTPSSRDSLNVRAQYSIEKPLNNAEFPWRGFVAMCCCAASLAPEPSRDSSRFNHPPRAEVTAFCKAAAPLSSSLSARQWLNSRGLVPSELQALDLIRITPDRDNIPLWMSGGRKHCVLIPLYSAVGELASVRLRDPQRPRYRGVPKGFTLKGLVMANDAALSMLRNGTTPERVIICEGETDFLTASMLAKESPVAVLGVSAGSWDLGIAARIPNKTLVQIWTDHDSAGEGYAQTIARTLHPRCMVVRNLETPHDLNALWKLGELPLSLELPSIPFTPSAKAPAKTRPAPQIDRSSEEVDGNRREAIRQTGLSKLQGAFEQPKRHQQALRAGLICGNFIDFFTQADLRDIEFDLLARSGDRREDHDDTRRTFHDGIKHGSGPGCRYIPENRPAPRRRKTTRPTTPPKTEDSTADKEPTLVETSPNFFETSAKYLKEEWLMDLSEGILKLYAPHGTGKTTAIAKLIRLLSGAALYLSPRTELCRTAGSKDMGLEFYKDPNVDPATAERLSMCLDSITKIQLSDVDGNPRRWRTLVLDEAEQLAHHLFGGTIGTRSYEVFDHLRMLILQSDFVILSDADIGPMTSALISAVFSDVPLNERPKIQTLRNNYKHKRTAFFTESKQENLAHLLRALIRGEKVAAACTSAKMAERFNAMLNGRGLESEGTEVCTLVRLLHEKRPDLKTLLVTAESKGDPDVSAFLSEPNETVSSYDAVLFSSAIGTGYSITARGFRCFLFAAANGPNHGLNAHAALQMLWRFRNPLDSEWLVWAEEAHYRATEDPAELRRALLIERSLTTSLVSLRTTNANGTFEKHPLDRAHFDLYLTVQTRHHSLSNHLHQSLREHMSAHGVDLVDLEPELNAHKTKSLRYLESKAGKQLNEEEVDGLLTEQASPRPFEELEDIHRRGPRNKDERRALNVDRISQALDDEPVEEDFRAFVESSGASISRGRRLALTAIALAGDLDCLAESTADVDLKSSYATHLQSHTARAVTLSQLLLAAGLDPEHIEDFSVTAQELRKTFVPWVKLYRDPLRAAGLNPDIKDLETSPIKLVRSALSQLGLSLFKKPDQARHDGKQIRTYRLDPSSLDKAWRWAKAPLRRHAPNFAVTHPRLLLNNGDFCDRESSPPQASAA